MKVRRVYGGSKPDFDTGEYGDDIFNFGCNIELKTQGTVIRTGD